MKCWVLWDITTQVNARPYSHLQFINISSARIQGEEKTITPFSQVQCEQFISLYKTLKSGTEFIPSTGCFVNATYLETSPTNGVRTWFVSHVMVSIWASRHAHNYGEFDAIPFIQRVTEDPPTPKQRIFNAIIFVLCFGTHERYREQLNFAHANGGLYVPAFQKFLQDMLQEWTGESISLATYRNCC